MNCNFTVMLISHNYLQSRICQWFTSINNYLTTETCQRIEDGVHFLGQTGYQ